MSVSTKETRNYNSISNLKKQIVNKYIQLQYINEKCFLKIVKVYDIKGKNKLTDKLNKVKIPEHKIYGILNVKGEIVPVFDFRGMQNMLRESKNKDQIAVIDAKGNGKIIKIGILFNDIVDIISNL